MKNLLIVFLLILFSQWEASAQKKEGVITYEFKVNMHRRLPKEQESMKSVLPEFQISQMQLFFKEAETFYKTVEEENEEETDLGNSHGARIVIRRPLSEIYTHLKNKLRIEFREFAGKQYLIEDSVKNTPWKMSSETKDIKGYTCKKATFYNEQRKQNITAWYTESIPLSIGPGPFNGLPGAILAVDVNDGENMVTAQQIEFKTIAKTDIKIPSGGKKITSKEFQTHVDEFMKQNNGGMKIIRN